MKDKLKKFEALLDEAKTVLVLQPEKPDTDSLSSSLAMEAFLENQGKKVVMYCQDEIPGYIRSLKGWDRVTEKFPNQFDLTIIVDTGGRNMVERTLEKHGKALASHPCVIIDHHATRNSMPFETYDIIEHTASTTELIYYIAREMKWKIDAEIGTFLVVGILADTSSFANSNTTAECIKVVSELADLGVNLPQIYKDKRDVDALTADLLHFKGKLLERVEFVADGKVAVNYATPEEMKQFSDIHDPADLVNKEALFSRNVLVSAFLRDYGTKIKISLRAEIDGVDKVAESMGGGGHSRAAGIRVDGRKLAEVREELIKKLTKLVGEHEALQHA